MIQILKLRSAPARARSGFNLMPNSGVHVEVAMVNRFQLMPSSSTSKIKVEFGGMAPGYPSRP
jgi:hypothetical protein